MSLLQDPYYFGIYIRAPDLETHIWLKRYERYNLKGTGIRDCFRRIPLSEDGAP